MTGSRWPSGPCSSTPSGGSPAKASPSPTGRCGSAHDHPTKTLAALPFRQGPRMTESTAPPTPDRVAIKRALVSVYDKAGLDDLVRGLHDAGVELVSTGGSAK